MPIFIVLQVSPWGTPFMFYGITQPEIGPKGPPVLCRGVSILRMGQRKAA
jgi:hypothetical protein